MAEVCVRRHSDSQYSRAIYEAIKGICYQKQCPNEERILKFVLRDFEWKSSDVANQLRLAVKDGLFREVLAVSHKGCKKGAEQMSYRPESTVNGDINGNTEEPVHTHDWYCFDCQESGEVVLCSFCPRVFHKKCAKANYISPQQQKWKCPSCEASADTASFSGLSKTEVNHMLKYTIGRIIEKFKILTKPVSTESCPDYDQYIFHPTNLSEIQQNVKKNKYKSPTHFLEDIKWLLHNATIYFGDDDELTNQAEELVDDVRQEIEEMLLCPTCYKLSNGKPKNWFCKPCDPPHEVVWAKMTGQPPWPAKVLKWNEDKTKALVRFFETRHQRAWVFSRHISPITVKPDVKKRPRNWLDAQQELQLYLEQLGQVQKIKIPVKTESTHEKNADEVVSEMPSYSQEKLPRSSVSCQTEEDTNKAVIDKLRKRIDDLEQDLGKTKEQLNSQEERHIEHENGKKTTLNMKVKVEKLLAALSERWQRDLEISELTDEQIRKNFEREQTEHNRKIDELRNAMLQQKQRELEYLKHSLQVKHQNEISTFREQTRKHYEALVESLTVKFTEQKERELSEMKLVIGRQFEGELKTQRDGLEREVEARVSDVKRQQKVVLVESVRETKRKQWCCNCEKEASYPCCWNTSYCSRQCQVVHWQQHRHQCSRNLVYVGMPTPRN